METTNNRLSHLKLSDEHELKSNNTRTKQDNHLRSSDPVTRDQKIFPIQGTTIFLGTCWGAEDKQLLLDSKVTTIINCALGNEPNHFESSGEFTYKSFRLKDFTGENIRPAIEECLPLLRDLDENRQNVLVHCSGGLSRSVSIVMAYLMKYKRLTLSQTVPVLECARGRPVLPNPSFWTTLGIYECEIFGFDAPSFDYTDWVVEDYGRFGFSEEAVRGFMQSMNLDANKVLDRLLQQN